MENIREKFDRLVKVKQDANAELEKLAVDVLNLFGRKLNLRIDNCYYDIPEYGEVYFKSAYINKNGHIEVEFEDADNGDTYEDTLIFMNVDDITFHDIVGDIIDRADENI